jgi:hypothetical protein
MMWRGMILMARQAMPGASDRDIVERLLHDNADGEVAPRPRRPPGLPPPRRRGDEPAESLGDADLVADEPRAAAARPAARDLGMAELTPLPVHPMRALWERRRSGAVALAVALVVCAGLLVRAATSDGPPRPVADRESAPPRDVPALPPPPVVAPPEPVAAPPIQPAAAQSEPRDAPALAATGAVATKPKPAAAAKPALKPKKKPAQARATGGAPPSPPSSRFNPTGI